MNPSSSIDTSGVQNNVALPPERRRAVTAGRTTLPPPRPGSPPPEHMKKRTSTQITPSFRRQTVPKEKTLLSSHVLNLEDTTIEDLHAKIEKSVKRDDGHEKFINGRPSTTVTLLRASASGDTDVLDDFADDESRIDDLRDERGKTAFHIAAIANQPKSIETLLVGNFDPNITDGHKGSWCRTPLHDAVLNDSYEAAEALLKSNTIKMNEKDGKGFTPLHYAASEGRTRFIPLLCMYGADIHLGTELPDSDTAGETVLQLTIRYLHSDTMLALLAQARDSAEKQKLFGKSLAEILYDVACREVLQNLFDEDAPLFVNDVISQHMQTVKAEYAPLIKALTFFRAILRCMDESSLDYSKELAAFATRATKNGKPFVLETFYRLAESQIDPNAVDSKKNTPLHNAAAKGDAQSVAILLKRGANIGAANEKGNLALHLAAKHGYKEIIGRLKEKDTNQETLASVNEKKETPFFVAAKKTQHEVLGSLYQEGLVDQKNEVEDTALLTILQNIDSADTDDYDKEELQNLLKDAEATIRFLLEKGANVHRKGSFDKTAVELVSGNKIFGKCAIKGLILSTAETQKPVIEEENESEAARLKEVEEDLRRMLLEEEESKQQAAEMEPQLVDESTAIPEEAMTDLLAELHLEPPQEPSNLSPLELFVQILEQADNLGSVEDLMHNLAIEGKNVLHFIAEHPDFSLFEKIVTKHFNDPLFPKLITQETLTEGETPLHTICRHHNVAMLRCLLASKNPEMKEYLKFTGCAKTKTTKRNAILYLGLAIEDAALKGKELSMRHAQCLETLEAFIKLYGEDETARLAAEQDAEGQNLLAISQSTGNLALAMRIVELHNTMGKK